MNENRNIKQKNINEDELIEKVEEELKKLEKLPWFTPKPQLLSPKQRMLLIVMKGFEAVIKYAQFYLRRVGEHFGIFIDYEIGKFLDKDGKPVLYMKLHGVHDFNELNPELVETIRYETISKDIFYEANIKHLHEKKVEKNEKTEENRNSQEK